MSITVHPMSLWNARQFINAITRDPRISLPNYRRANLRKAFTAIGRGKKEAIKIQPPKFLRLPNRPVDILAAVVKWYTLAANASHNGNWYITTAHLVSPTTIEVHADKSKLYIVPPSPPASASGPSAGGTSPSKPGSRTPPPKHIDFTKPNAKSGKAASQPAPAPPTPQIKIIPKRLSNGITGNVFPIPAGTSGITIPPYSFRTKGGPYYNDSKGIMAVVVDRKPGSNDDKVTPLVAKAKRMMAYLILHEIVHAGLADKSKPFGHCYPELSSLDAYFKTNISSNACLIERAKKLLQAAGKTSKRSPKPNGAVNGRVRTKQP